MTPMMMTLTGPSCAGKTFLLKMLLDNYPGQFTSLVGYTTRPRREGEVDGFEYNFIDEATFESELNAGNLCQSVQFGSNYYGTPTRHLTDAFEAGKVPLRIVEPGGVGQFEKVCADLGAKVFAIYVTADIEVVTSRWLDRYHIDVAEAEEQHAFTRIAYAGRIAKCLTEEFAWVNERPYNFYIKSNSEIHSMAYALARIATGNVSMDVANRLQPYHAVAA